MLDLTVGGFNAIPCSLSDTSHNAGLLLKSKQAILVALLLLTTVFHTTVNALGAICEHPDGTTRFETPLELQECHTPDANSGSAEDVSGTDCVDTRLPSNIVAERGRTQKLINLTFALAPLYFLPVSGMTTGIPEIISSGSSDFQANHPVQTLASLSTIILVI